MPQTIDLTIENIVDTILKIRPIHTSTTHTITIGSAFFCDASGGAFAITLPPAADNESRVIVIIKTDSSANAVTVTRAGSDTINGATTYSLPSQYKYVILINDDDNGDIWYVISSN